MQKDLLVLLLFVSFLHNSLHEKILFVRLLISHFHSFSLSMSGEGFQKNQG